MDDLNNHSELMFPVFYLNKMERTKGDKKVVKLNMES